MSNNNNDSIGGAGIAVSQILLVTVFSILLVS